MDVLDALSRTDRIRHITTRHEQGAAFMADVHGRLTGRAAVAMATLGPGATNLVTGVADAFLDRAPMVALTGQAALGKVHKESHQYVDIVRLFGPITKWNQRIERPATIPEIVRKAFRVAQLSKPGPTHIELPEDIAATRLGPTDDLRPLVPGGVYFPEPTQEALDHAARLIAASTRPHRPGRQRRAAAARVGRPARVCQWPARAGGRHVHGQGGDGRSLAPLADGGRPPGARPRADRLRPRRPRHRRRLRPRRVRALALEPRGHEADHPHRHPAGGGGPGLPAGGRADRRHRRLAGAPARRGAADGDQRARRQRAPRGQGDARQRRPAAGAAGRPGRLCRGRGLAHQAPTGDRRPAPGARPVRHRGQRRRGPQDLGRPPLPGLRAQHGHHLQRVRRHGHLAARRDRRQARPPRAPRRGPQRGRRLPDERPGAGDGQARGRRM